MDLTGARTIIDQAWEERDRLSPRTDGDVRVAVEAALDGLDSGRIRVATRRTGAGDGDRNDDRNGDDDAQWTVHQWTKKAVLLSFLLTENMLIEGSPGQSLWWDKVPSKFAGWGEEEFRAAGFRAVPGSIVRRGAFVDRGAVLMPSFVNIGATVGAGTMVDTWATVGSCAQVGANCHLSGGVGIGGVLEPLQAEPTIIEDNCFIGARSEVVEGVIVGEGSVLSMGVFVTRSTKIVDRSSGEIFQGRIPPFSVVVPGTLPGRPLPDGSPGPSLACAVIVKRVDAQTRSKTSVNDLLRE